MGLPSLPFPCEGGVLCLILVNTAISFSIVKGLVYSVLRVLGIRRSDSADGGFLSYTGYSSDESYRCEEEILRNPPGNHFLDEFRSRTRAVRFESVRRVLEEEQRECAVCLSRFEPESEIHLLFCEHMFHKECLDKWLGYWNLTCPLCRMPLIPHDHDYDQN